jgi:hypothetical protein
VCRTCTVPGPGDCGCHHADETGRVCSSKFYQVEVSLISNRLWPGRCRGNLGTCDLKIRPGLMNWTAGIGVERLLPGGEADAFLPTGQTRGSRQRLLPSFLANEAFSCPFPSTPSCGFRATSKTMPYDLVVFARLPSILVAVDRYAGGRTAPVEFRNRLYATTGQGDWRTIE